jgi:3-phosphoglycerate kinase
MAIKYLKSSTIKNKTVLVRGSVDAPVDENSGKVSDDFRLRSFLPTIKFLIKSGDKVIICGKRGRAKGKAQQALSLKPAAEKLADLLGLKFIATDYNVPDYGIPHLIFYSGDFREGQHLEQIKKIPNKDIVFLENLEFYPEELDNDIGFGKQLAALAEVYVDDDFSKCHHPVASNVAVTRDLSSYAGLLLEQEIKFLDSVLKGVKHPFVVMTGGIKLSEKVGALQNLGEKADKILVGGGVANLMFKAKGLEVGLSRIEEGEMKTAWAIEKNYKNKLVLPVDVVVANEKLEKHSIRVCAPHEVGKTEMILDAGPKTILAFSKELKLAKTILWSGPLGLFEKKPFDTATMALARLIGGRGKGKAFAVAGGGDTVDAIRQAHQFEHLDHVSTGGGAMLEYLAGKKLPGIEALK